MTHRKLLKEISNEFKTANIESADLDARVLIKHVLQIDDTFLFKNFDQSVNKKAVLKIQELAKRRGQNEPIAYITKHKEFYGLNFYINNTVLIPRPESEELVEKSIKFLKSIKSNAKILDMGTGSGNIIISIVKSLDGLSTLNTFDFFACDISAQALKVAEHNAKQNAVIKNIKFLESNLFSNISPDIKFDLIIANLPYVPKPELRIEQSIEYEPYNAIFATDNGAEIIKKFLSKAKNYLNTNGVILIELDPRNAEEIKIFAKKIYPNTKIELQKDLANFDRYLNIQLS